MPHATTRRPPIASKQSQILDLFADYLTADRHWNDLCSEIEGDEEEDSEEFKQLVAAESERLRIGRELAPLVGDTAYCYRGLVVLQDYAGAKHGHPIIVRPLVPLA